MARQTPDRLKKIGLEAFADIDEIYGPAKRPPPAVKKGNQFLHQKGNQFPFDYPKGKPAPLPTVIDSNKAAQLCKGRVYLDYRIEYEFFY